MSDNGHHVENNKRIELSQQQLSIGAAALLMCAFFIFLAGFFWGKQSSLQLRNNELTSFSFADTIYTVFSAVQEQAHTRTQGKERNE